MSSDDHSFNTVRDSCLRMDTPSLRERLLDGQTVVGTFQLLNSPMAAEMVGVAGMDFTILDQEHGPLTAESCVAMCAAAQNSGAEPVVRVRNNTESEIQRALDIGAAGVEIPQIETGADARAAVDHACFDPIGSRGLSPYVRAGGYTGHEDYTDRQNEETALIVHIEGKRGVKNLDDIVDVAGIDVLFLGPYDISQSLGIPGQVHDRQVEDLMSSVCDRAAEENKIVGTYADDPEMARKWIDAGAQYVAVAVDGAIFTHALEDIVESVHE
jgi:4-hydroxy-2-oxoheptanedioate aldolase